MEDIFSTRCKIIKYKFMYSVSRCVGDKCERMTVGGLVAPARWGIAFLVIDNIDKLYNRRIGETVAEFI